MWLMTSYYFSIDPFHNSKDLTILIQNEIFLLLQDNYLFQSREEKTFCNVEEHILTLK